MMIKYKLTAAFLSVALGLSACSSEREGGGDSFRQAGAFFVGAIASVRADKGPPEVRQVTAKQLDNTKIPALQINPEAIGGSQFLKRITTRTDANPGSVAVWRSSDGAQVFLRNGVLIGTRGVRGDLISADVNATVRAVSAARAGNGERRYFISNGSYGDQELVLSCDIANLGREVTQVVHLTFQTVHLRETCVGGEGGNIRIENDYWVQPSNRIVRKSRQWAGPLSGYFEIILLKN